MFPRTPNKHPYRASQHSTTTTTQLRPHHPKTIQLSRHPRPTSYHAGCSRPTKRNPFCELHLEHASTPTQKRAISCQGWKIDFTGISALRQIQDKHWRGPKWKAAWPTLRAIEVYRRLGENDLRNGYDAIANICSMRIHRWQSVKRHIFAVFVARGHFKTELSITSDMRDEQSLRTSVHGVHNYSTGVVETGAI